MTTTMLANTMPLMSRPRAWDCVWLASAAWRSVNTARLSALPMTSTAPSPEMAVASTSLCIGKAWMSLPSPSSRLPDPSLMPVAPSVAV